jgi:5-carboxyvanillate decarboxylase
MTEQLRRIAVEEAFCIPEVSDELARVARGNGNSLDLLLLRGIYANSTGWTGGQALLEKLLDFEGPRLAEMDLCGVDVQVLSLTAPGVQLFDADTASELATLANDRLAAVISRHPHRFAGLASFAPQAPRRAAREMERAIRELGLNGFIVNSHTNGEYLDDPKYWPILEAAEALEACIYIHPRSPSGMSGAFGAYGLDSAMWGYGVEAGTHAVRLMASGVLDRFPKLKICLGHMGEAVHFWLWRFDFLNARAQRSGRSPKTKQSMTEYFRQNFVITTSGVLDPLALEYSIARLGADNVLWAIDYPYNPTDTAVAFLDAAKISDEDRAKIYHGNAERVFKLCVPQPEQG